jgi:hypothetical protein
LPTIYYDIQSEKENKNESRIREKKKAEILLKFKNYENKKLRQIIQDSNSYADYAIEAAREILEKRK